MKNVRLSAVGDILLTGMVAGVIKSKGPEEPFVFVLEELKKSDLVFGNLEGPLSNCGNPLKNKCCLYSLPETVKSLKSAGLGVLSLANNHIFDYGYKAFEDTISLLKENNISWFGAGKDLEEAKRPAILSINNLLIGFLGYSWDFIGSINATKNRFGTAPLNEKLILEDIKKLKKKTHVVIVSLHWGYERERYPLPSQRKLAHRIIDAGASLILGHHPHVLQGIESYKKGIIVYSLGNFIFPDIVYKNYRIVQKPENKESIIFQCNISKEGIDNFDIAPIMANDLFQPVVLQNKDKDLVAKKIKELSKAFELNNYSYFWKRNRTRKDLPDMGEHSVFYLYFYRLYYKLIKKLNKLLVNQIIKKYE
ncbi:MAG: CapA family protein [Thermoplasmata archaeon]|nr:CapA family protein [Thermoplasmata archaeon]